jgi:hypothetical protein
VGFHPPANPLADFEHVLDHSAFLFSLTNSLGHPEKLAASGRAANVCCSRSYSAVFGSFWIQDNSNTVESWTYVAGTFFAESASTGVHPLAQGDQRFKTSEVVAWVV